MDFGRVGDVADILAAVGVICSLLFLAYEIRLTHKEMQLSNWRQLLDSLRDYKAVTNDVSFSDLIERGNKSYSALSDAEKRSFGQYLEQGIHVLGNFTKHAGTIPNQLTGLEGAIGASMIDLLDQPGVREWYVEYKPKGKLMPATYATIDGILAGGGKP